MFLCDLGLLGEWDFARWSVMVHGQFGGVDEGI